METDIETQDIAIYGFGGFGREVTNLINDINTYAPIWNFIGYFDDASPVGSENSYGKVLGGLEALNAWEKPINIVIAIASPAVLKLLFNRIVNPLVQFPNLIAPTVSFGNYNSFTIGKGNIITNRCSFSCDISIGNFNIFNSDGHLGHDVKIGSFNSIGPGVRISGNVTIGDENFIAVGAIIIQKIIIENRTKLGAGAVLMRNTKNDSLYVGNPAKRMKF